MLVRPGRDPVVDPDDDAVTQLEERERADDDHADRDDRTRDCELGAAREARRGEHRERAGDEGDRDEDEARGCGAS